MPKRPTRRSFRCRCGATFSNGIALLMHQRLQGHG